MLPEITRNNLKNSLYLAATILALLLSGAILFRVSIAETAGLKILQSFGFEEAALTVTHVGLAELRITELSLDEKFRAKNLSVGYSVAALLKGTADWISVNGLNIDISAPKAGALAKLLAHVKLATQQNTGETLAPLPSFSLTNGVFIGAYETRKFRSEVSVSISPALLIEGQALSSAEVQTAAGRLKMEGLTATFSGDINRQSGKLVLENGVLRHMVEDPDWAPLTIAGSAEIDQQTIAFMGGVGLGTETPLFRLQGHHDLAAKKGQMDVDIHDITFDKAGLQPSDLSSSLQDFLPLDTLLSSQSKVHWDAGQVTADSLILANDTQIIGPDFSVRSKHIEIAVNATYNLQSGAHKARIQVKDLEGVISQGNHHYTLNKAAIDLDVEKFGQYLTLHTLTASLSDDAKEPQFAPLVLTATGKTIETDLVFEGRITDEGKRILFAFDGIHNLENGEGSGSAKFSHSKFSSTGLQPRHLAAVFKEMPGQISGFFEADMRVIWSPESGFLYPVITSKLRNAEYQQGNVSINNLNATVTSKNIKLNQPFKAVVSNVSGDVDADGKKAHLKTLLGHIVMKEEWDDAEFILQQALFIPQKGGILKPTISVTGKMTLTARGLDFNGEATSDFLGPFATFLGRHDLETGLGMTQLVVPGIEFEQDGLQPSDLVTGIEPTLVVSGGIAANIEMAWQPAGLKTQAQVNLENIGIKTEDAQIMGLSGQIDIDDLLPLTIRSVQEVSAEKVMTAANLTKPVLRFRVIPDNGTPVLYLDHLQVGVVGGKALIKEAVLDTGADSNRVTVQFSNIDLEKAMNLTELEDVTASGSLNGQIPLHFHGEKLLIDVGVLETVGPGLLQLKSEKARAALSAGGDQTKLLFDILENFQYSDLSVRIQKLESGDDTVTLHTKGANPDVENNRPVILNINLSTNLDKIFQTLLDGYRLSEKALRATVKKQ